MSDKEWKPELAIIAGVLNYPDPERQFIEAAELIQASDFDDLRCQAVWRMMQDMLAQGIPVTMDTVFRQAGKTKIERHTGDFNAFWVECGEGAPPTMCALDIREASKRRRLVAVGAELMNAGKDKQSDVDEALARADEMLRGKDLATVELTEPATAVRLMLEDLDQRIASAGKLQGIPTGIHSLDHKLDGLQFSEMTIVGARPSQGKTAFGITVVDYACYRKGFPTLFVTLEMRVAVLMRRLASGLANISLTDLRKGNLDEIAQIEIREFSNRARKAPLYWIDATSGGMDVRKLCTTIRRYCKQYGIKLVIVDYLQKIHGTGNHEKRTYELGQVSTELKQCASKTGAAFLVLAQLNRDSAKSESRPRSIHLGDSKQIEQDADTIVLIHRPEEQQAMLFVDKQRDGEVGCVAVDFDGSRGRFTMHREPGQ